LEINEATNKKNDVPPKKVLPSITPFADVLRFGTVPQLSPKKK